MGKKKRLINRILSVVLSLALVFTGVSFQGMAVQAEEAAPDAEGLDVPQAEEADAPEAREPKAQAEDGLILHYDFDQGDNSEATIVMDKTGNTAHSAEVVKAEGAVAGTYAWGKENVLGKTMNTLELNIKNEDYGPYLKLPDDIFNGCDSATISIWAQLNPGANDAFHSLWNFQSDENKYFFLWADGWDGWGSMAIISKEGWNANQSVTKGRPMDKGRWLLLTVVMDGTKMTYYENGKAIGSTNTGVSLSDLGHTTMNYIGNTYSTYDGTTTGKFADFRIYNRAMSAEEVSGMYSPSDDEIISADKDVLSLSNTTGLVESIKLPSKGLYGSDISWTSQNSGLAIGEKGEDGYYNTIITRPISGSGEATGNLIATITYGNGTPVTKEIAVTVAERYSDQQIVDHDKETVGNLVGSLDNVFQQTITLPSVGEWGASITWEWVGDAGVVTIPAQADESGKFIAQVKRPEAGSADAVGKLRANLSSGSVKGTADLDVKIWAFRGTPVITEKASSIDVTTLTGHSPSLPNYLSVKYSDGSTNKLKITWPASIEPEKYAAAGAFTVEGTVEGQAEKLTANVTVTDGEDTVKNAVSTSFNLNDISLDKIGEDGSILTQNRERDITYLKLLDNKQMLYNFYKTFGENDVIANVTPLGGWDAPTGLLRGHSTGHYISALSLAYASTKDAELKAKLDNMVSELHRLQQKSKGDPAAFTTKGVQTSGWSTDPNEWGEGFVSAYSPDQFALLEQYTPYGSPNQGIWAPYYTLHKLLAGLIDAYRCAGNDEALVAAKALGKWAYNRLRVLPQEQLTKMWDMYIAGEFGGFNECMAELYLYAKADGNADADVFLAGAKLFDNTRFFRNLAANVDDIQNRHANQHIPQIIGAIKMYEATVTAGQPEVYYYNVAENFWQMTVSRYAYSTGGVGLGEKFTEPYKQANYIGARNCETCAAYNMMKLSMMLNNYDPDNAEYMDYYERTLYNQILASQSPIVTDDKHNSTTYMLPICPGAWKSSELSDDYNSFTCCHGTGMENHVKYQEAAYAKTADTLYVGLYLPSTVSWQEKGVKVVQETTFPSETTKLTVQKLGNAAAQSFDMKLRVPYWATKGFSVKVNGEQKIANAQASSYVSLKGIKENDVIEVTMPWNLHLDKTPDTLDGSEVASIMYGPFVMAAQDSSTNWLNIVLTTKLDDHITVSTNEQNGFPVLSSNGYQFVPMFAPELAEQPYHAYVKVSVSPEGGVVWDKQQLANVIRTAESKIQSDYTADSWKKMQDALEAANAVNGNAVATQAQIEEAAKNLQDAINGLVKVTEPTKVDKTALAKAIADAGSKKEADYTASSWKKMQDALAAANNVNSKADATQAQVDEAAKNLQDAIKALAKPTPVVVKPGAPSSLKAAWAGAKKVKITWKKASNADRYLVYRSYKKASGYKKIGQTTKTSYRDTSATPGKTAYYKVIAYNGKTKGAYSGPKSAYILKTPGSVKAKASGKNVTVSFGKVSKASGYAIYRSTKKNGTYKRVANLKSAKTIRKRFAKMKKGTYYYKVKAYTKTSGKTLFTGYSSAVKVKVK